MVAVLSIGPMRLITKPGNQPCGQAVPSRIHVKLQKIVASKLISDWLPEQISGWPKIQYPDDESLRVSHETVYRSLFIQARGVLKKELLGTCGPGAAFVARSTLVPADSHAVKSSMPSPSEKDRPKSRTALFPVIGKAISFRRVRLL